MSALLPAWSTSIVMKHGRGILQRAGRLKLGEKTILNEGFMENSDTLFRFIIIHHQGNIDLF